MRGIQRENRNCNEQMCWRCKNATGGCSWSKDLKPIKGWKAKKTYIRDSGAVAYSSYKILYCPQFDEDD